MSQALPSQQEAAPPIRAIIIEADSTYEVCEIKQDIPTMQGLVGGNLELVHTDRCTLWCNQDDQRAGVPLNRMATFLWWKLAPEMEGRDALGGPVFVTGVADDCGDSWPLPDEVVDLYDRMEQIRRKHEGAQ
jgi:Domain of unknown function (DUF3846)